MQAAATGGNDPHRGHQMDPVQDDDSDDDSYNDDNAGSDGTDDADEGDTDHDASDSSDRKFHLVTLYYVILTGLL
jgi:hypothetical protein